MYFGLNVNVPAKAGVSSKTCLMSRPKLQQFNDSVGTAVASNPRGPRFESNHRN